MRDVDQFEYYQLREQKERALARNAVNPAIISIHLEMAARYADLVKRSTPLLHIVQ